MSVMCRICSSTQVDCYLCNLKQTAEGLFILDFEAKIKVNYIPCLINQLSFSCQVLKVCVGRYENTVAASEKHIVKCTFLPPKPKTVLTFFSHFLMKKESLHIQ